MSDIINFFIIQFSSLNHITPLYYLVGLPAHFILTDKEILSRSLRQGCHISINLDREFHDSTVPAKNLVKGKPKLKSKSKSLNLISSMTTYYVGVTSHPCFIRSRVLGFDKSAEAATNEKFANICSYLPAGRIFRFLEQIPQFPGHQIITRTDCVFPAKQR